MDIVNVIQSLKNKRKIFHSEDDLKLSFGMEISTLYPDCQVRLERPIKINMICRDDKPLPARAPIDVVVIDNNGDIIPIELKYKTDELELNHGNEEFQLTAHGAIDLGRYSFRKDIYRIEQYLATHTKCRKGYVLILTNDNAYFDTDVSLKDNYDKNYSFHNGALISKKDTGWNYGKIKNSDKYEFCDSDNRWEYKNNKKPHWTCKKELFYRLDLKNDYVIAWNNYSTLKETEFKHCLINITID